MAVFTREDVMRPLEARLEIKLALVVPELRQAMTALLAMEVLKAAGEAGS